MSANVESMFSANGITPWHREGTVVQGAVTAAQGWALSGQDFTVEKFQLHTPEGAAVHNCYGTRRTDTGEILTRCKVVSKIWEPTQNRDGWEVLDPMFESGQITPETAGVLDGGRKVWILASFKGHEEADIGGGDIVKQYVLFANGHDGTMAVTIGGTNIRVVCQNTLAMANEEGTFFRMRHVEGSKSKLKDAAAIIGKMGQTFQATADTYRMLAQTKVQTGQQIADFVAQVYGVEEVKAQQEGKVSGRLSSVLENFESGMGADLRSAKGTVWGLYNALTEYVSHKGAETSKRLDSIAFGNRSNVLRRGLEVATVMGKGIPLEAVFDSQSDVVHKAQEAAWAAN